MSTTACWASRVIRWTVARTCSTGASRCPNAATRRPRWWRWSRPSAHRLRRHGALQASQGIGRVKAERRGAQTMLGLLNVSSGTSMAARGVLNSAFLYHCAQGGPGLAIGNPVHLTPFAEIDAEPRALAEALI